MDNMIGLRIRQRRKELHITQTQIYDTLGISSGNLSGIENGRSLPSATALLGLSEMLDCTVDWILKGDSPISEKHAITNNEDNYNKAQLLTYYDGMSAPDQKELLMIAKMKYDKEKATSSLSEQDIETA